VIKTGGRGDGGAGPEVKIRAWGYSLGKLKMSHRLRRETTKDGTEELIGTSCVRTGIMTR